MTIIDTSSAPTVPARKVEALKPDLLLTNSSGAFTDGMSEFVLMRMLMHARKAERIEDRRGDVGDRKH